MLQHLYISPVMQVSIWPVVIIPQSELWAIKFPFKTLPQGKILLTKSLMQRHKFEANFEAFEKVCVQMLNNFTAFSTVFYNFHAALLFLLMIYFYSFYSKISLLNDFVHFTSSIKQISDHHISGPCKSNTYVTD